MNHIFFVVGQEKEEGRREGVLLWRCCVVESMMGNFLWFFGGWV